MEKQMSKLFFSKEEKLQIENNVLRTDNFQLQANMLINERQAMVAEFCKKNSKKTEDVININLQEGSVEFKEEEKGGKKK